tara:strand:+ start:873 stop:1358 length:486 start_codon:yes stop_codon:yes gene_type:complete
VYSISIVLLTAIVALLMGITSGILYSRKFPSQPQEQREVAKNLERLQQDQKDYQQEVSKHFTDTAKLLAHFAESYREIHNHLACGAENLCEYKISANIINRLPDSADENGTNDESYKNISQPLDYAPKNSPYETGMLNEEFGIEKETEESPIAAMEEPVLK